MVHTLVDDKGNTFTGNLLLFRQHLGITDLARSSRQNQSLVRFWKGERKSIKILGSNRWRLATTDSKEAGRASGSKHYKADQETYTFVNSKTGDRIQTTRTGLTEHDPSMTTKHIYKLVKLKQKSVLGWSIEE